MRRPPGQIRDAISQFLGQQGESGATVREIQDALSGTLGDVASSSVRSYLRLNTPGSFERIARGKYRSLQSPRG